MADDEGSGQLWAVMHRAAQQIIDELRARRRTLDPSRIAARVGSQLADVPGVPERIPVLVDELRRKLGARRA